MLAKSQLANSQISPEFYSFFQQYLSKTCLPFHFGYTRSSIHEKSENKLSLYATSTRFLTTDSMGSVIHIYLITPTYPKNSWHETEQSVCDWAGLLSTTSPGPQWLFSIFFYIIHPLYPRNTTFCLAFHLTFFAMWLFLLLMLFLIIYSSILMIIQSWPL